MKHILPYTALNENVGRGSILFIKGKEEGGQRKLFATHILGYSEFKPGVKMFFLPQDFYRIKMVDGEIRAVKVGLSDSALRSVLNIKAPGKISIVQNNKKTPWHWESLKHTNIGSAIRALEDKVKADDFILEQSDSGREAKFDLLYNHLVKKVIKSAFLGEKENIVFTDYHVARDLSSSINDASESGSINEEWDVNFTFLYLGKEHRDLLEEFGIDQIIDIDLYFNSEAYVKVYHDPGDRETPPSWDVDVQSVETELNDDQIYLEGSTGTPDSELNGLIYQVKKMVNSMDDSDVRHLLDSNIKIPEHMKKGE